MGALVEFAVAVSVAVSVGVGVTLGVGVSLGTGVSLGVSVLWSGAGWSAARPTKNFADRVSIK